MTSQTATIGHGTGVTPAFEYDAFISYRRVDAGWHARTLRQRLLDIRIPPGITSASPDRRLHIYLDQIYERATDDFFENTIKPALRTSRHLIVVTSPSSAESLADGGANWLVREIEYFRSLPPDGRSISIAISAGDVSGSLPGRLDETHPNIERVDLRKWRRYRPAAFDNQLMTLAATLHDIRPADMPALRREDERRHVVVARRRRLISGTAVILLLIAIAAGVWQYRRAREAVAASLWNRLDFSTRDVIAPDELGALWEMRVASAGLRGALVAELMKSGDRGSRMGLRPAPTVRALFLRWPDETVADVFDALVDATRTREASEHEALWHACEALGREMPVQRVPAALDSVLGATKGRSERLAVPTMEILADKLTTAAAPAAFEVVLTRMEETADIAALRHFWAAVRAFGGRVTPDQAKRTLALALRAADQTTEPDDLEMLAGAVGAFPGRLTAQEALRLLAPLTKGIEQTTWALEGLGQAVEAIGHRLPPEQAQTVAALVLRKIDGADPFATRGLAAAVEALAPTLDSVAAKAALDPLLRAAARAEVDFALEPLVAAIGVTATRLTPEQASVALPSVLETFSRTRADPLKQPAIDPVIETFVRRLTPSLAHMTAIGLVDQMDPSRRSSASPADLTESTEALRRRMLDSVLRNLADYRRESSGTSTPTNPVGGPPPYDGRVLRPAMAALKDALTAPEAGEVVSRLLHALRDTSNAGRIYAVEAMVGPVADRLGPEERPKAVAEVMRKIEITSDLSALSALASLTAALRAQLLLPQVTPTLHRLLGLMDTADVFARPPINSAFQLLSAAVPPDDVATLLPLVLKKIESDQDFLVSGSLSEALQEWIASGKLTEAQTRQVVDTVLRTIANTADADRLHAFVSLIAEAPGPLEPAQAQIVLRSLLSDERRGPGFPGLLQPRATLAHTVRAVASKLTREQRNAAAAVMQSELAWSNTEQVSSASAEALMELHAGAPPEAYVRIAVEALKYPAAAGSATDVLLAALRRAMPQAPAKEGGLQAILDWIAKEFPDIDLQSVPRCPSPRQPGLACPVAGVL